MDTRKVTPGTKTLTYTRTDGTVRNMEPHEDGTITPKDGEDAAALDTYFGATIVDSPKGSKAAAKPKVTRSAKPKATAKATAKATSPAAAADVTPAASAPDLPETNAGAE